jgi:hypothetical protein
MGREGQWGEGWAAVCERSMVTAADLLPNARVIRQVREVHYATRQCTPVVVIVNVWRRL